MYDRVTGQHLRSYEQTLLATNPGFNGICLLPNGYIIGTHNDYLSFGYIVSDTVINWYGRATVKYEVNAGSGQLNGGYWIPGTMFVLFADSQNNLHRYTLESLVPRPTLQGFMRQRLSDLSGDDYTFAVTYKPRDSFPRQVLLEEAMDKDTWPIQLEIASDSIRAYTPQLSAYAGYTLNHDATWVHVIVRRGSNNRPNLWVNGIDRGNSSSAQATIGLLGEIALGTQRTRADRYFVGQIFSIPFFDRALTDEECEQLYQFDMIALQSALQ